MKVIVQPRLQVESWSLYWKESLRTQTQCLEPRELELPDSCSLADLLAAHAAAQGWQPAASLVRLPGFEADWERVLVRGRELQPSASLKEALAVASGPAAAAAEAPRVTVVRVVLKADGWKIRQQGDFLSDTDSDSDD